TRPAPRRRAARGEQRAAQTGAGDARRERRGAEGSRAQGLTARSGQNAANTGGHARLTHARAGRFGWRSIDVMSEEFRIEKDGLGEVLVPAQRLWGAQTQRAIDNFPIGVGRFRWGRPVIRAFGVLKK